VRSTSPRMMVANRPETRPARRRTSNEASSDPRASGPRWNLKIVSWVFRNVLILGALGGVYAWVCAYLYLWSFYGRFAADPDQVGLGRSVVTGRVVAIGFIFAASAVLLIIGPACVIVGASREVAAALRAKRRTAERSVQPHSAFFGTLAKSMINSAQWVGTTPSPLLNREGMPEAAAIILLFGEDNGTTVVFSLDSCSVAHVPTADIALDIHFVNDPNLATTLPRC
jgi:hypothetical protein